MCGRFSLAADGAFLKRFFRVYNEISFEPRYNIAPEQNIPVISINQQKRELNFMRWGLVPQWTKSVFTTKKMINARAETIEFKPAFREAFYHRRCLIPADGFFEWKRKKDEKIPVRIVLPGKDIFAFAGVWDCWTSPQGNNILSCCIITTEANDFMREIHGRMPVILACEEEQDVWLRSNSVKNLKGLLRPYRGEMYAYQVSRSVNSPQNDGPDLIKEV